MPGLKTGMENGMFWSKIGSGFGDRAALPHHEFQGVPPRAETMRNTNIALCQTV